MKNKFKKIGSLSLVGFTLLIVIISCANTSEDGEIALNNNLIIDNRTVNQDIKAYWYDGKAELSSYKLTQARYGETHEGTAVLVYVTEPFSKSNNTKADTDRKDNVPVLKLNKTKKFTTGIYPYSMMNSTFFPFEGNSSSLKIASSMQEWCGMTYLEMKNEEKFIFKFDSYFEGYSFKNKKVKKTILEDDIWSLIRLNPDLLPTGKVNMIPSMFFLRLRSTSIKSYDAQIIKSVVSDTVNSYKITYPTLDRSITIQYSSVFPYSILNWKESHYSGYGKDKKILVTKAELIKTIKTDYWNKNLNQHKDWRTKLGLK